MGEVIKGTIQYIAEHQDMYIKCIQTHVFLSFVTLAVCIVLGVPLGYICGKNDKVSSGIISTEDISHLFGIFSGAIYAILLKKGLLNFKKNFVLQKKDTSNNPKDELNKLLDKVRISGYASLSDKEKAKMVELSKNIH